MTHTPPFLVRHEGCPKTRRRAGSAHDAIRFPTYTTAVDLAITAECRPIPPPPSKPEDGNQTLPLRELRRMATWPPRLRDVPKPSDLLQPHGAGSGWESADRRRMWPPLSLKDSKRWWAPDLMHCIVEPGLPWRQCSQRSGHVSPRARSRSRACTRQTAAATSPPTGQDMSRLLRHSQAAWTRSSEQVFACIFSR